MKPEEKGPLRNQAVSRRSVGSAIHSTLASGMRRVCFIPPDGSFHFTETNFVNGSICHTAPRFPMNGVQRNNHSRTTRLSVSTAVTPTGSLAIGQRCNHRADWRGFKRRYEARCSVCCISGGPGRLFVKNRGKIGRVFGRIQSRPPADRWVSGRSLPSLPGMGM